ncbi:MAG: GNAT family N-acetyltransferase [Planctomycetota bacterium]|jgi:ribosomal protein S18 acetylase RimI-like enzyme
MVVRPAASPDVPRIVALWREMWDLHAKLDPPRYVATPAAEQVIDGWVRDSVREDRSVVLVAEDGGEIAGYLLGMILENPPVVPHQFFGYVSELAVAERKRGAGVGRALLAAAEEWFRAQGLSLVELSVSERNEDAVRFWKREGFSDYLLRLRKEL